MSVRMKYGSPFVLFLSAWMLFNGACTREGSAPSPVSSVQRPQHAGTGAGELAVTILPETPTVTSQLQAEYSARAGQVTCRWDLNGQDLAGETGSSLSSNSRFSKGDRISVTLTAGDASASASVVIVNSPPVVQSLSISPAVIYRGIDITAVPVGVDADGDDVQFSYKWSINGEETGDDSAVLPGDRFRRGDVVSLTVTPSDPEGAGMPLAGKSITISDARPRFVSTPPENFQGENYSYTAVAEDPDGDPIVYSLLSGPQGMTMDPATGTLTLRIEKKHEGTHAIEIDARDPQGLKTEQKYSLTLSIP